jgi:hypothetical protein
VVERLVGRRLRHGEADVGGVEAMAMLAKGQVRAAPANDIPAQRTFVANLFGLAA